MRDQINRIATFLFIVLITLPVFAAENPKQNRLVLRNPEVGPPVTPFRFDRDVRTLPAPPAWKPGDPIKEIPRRSKQIPELPKDYSQPVGKDPLLEVQAKAPVVPSGFTTPSRNFPGGGFSGVNPPDTEGDVGPNHYIQAINGSGGTQVRIWDKATPTPNLLANFLMESLASAGACTNGLGDPIVVYDRYADRWLLSEFSTSGNNLCVYISQTPDPIVGGWFAYAFTAPQFPDYPKYAIWPTDENGGQGSIVVVTNEDGPVVYALHRGNMLAGLAAPSIRFSTIPPLSAFGFEGTLAAGEPDGPNFPPVGDPIAIMQHRDTEAHGAGPCTVSPGQDCMEIWDLSVDWNTPANTTLANTQNIIITEIDSELCGFNPFFCFPQPGSATTLDPLREPIMNRLQYMNVGGQQYLIGNLVTDVDATDHGGMRWFELRGGAGAWSLHQEGTYAPDIHHRWIGGISMDRSNNIAMGYSKSSTTVHPEISYTGRLSSDPAGVMTQTETQIADGTSPNGSNRWGDYANMTLDPTDDCTFWYTNMFNTSPNWSTQIASMKFDACGFAGSVALDQSSYLCSDTMGITVADAHLIGAGTQNVTIWSTTEPTPETVTLTENPPGSGAFFGTFPTSTVPPATGDGMLSVSHGDTITVQYIDLDDGSGGTNVPVQDTATTDCLAPVISNVQAINITGTLATITWDTDEDSDSEVTYDLVTPPTANTISDSAKVTSHSIQITGLTPCTQYFFFVRSADAAGNQATADNNGSYYTFATLLETSTNYVSTDVPKPILDQQTATSTITIAEDVTVADINLQINITHSWDGDMDISLQSPNGTIIDLSSDNGGSGNNYTDTIFDDEAATPITAGTPPFTGTFSPEQPLSTYDGMSSAGVWTLRIFDDFNADTGTLNAWNLTITTGGPCAPCPEITLSPPTLPGGTLGGPYSQTLTASGGTAPYTYNVTGGSLPNGLILNANTGEISGTPTATGTFNFTITAMDLNTCTGSHAYTITISDCTPITLAPSVLPDGNIGVSYNQVITASGGTEPYSYNVSAGVLPTGLALSQTTGVISGTPTETGTFNFQITATDINACTGSQTYTVVIDVLCGTITLSPATLPDGVTGAAYSETITASGGTAPYTFAVTAGTLPAGLSLNGASGEISGTPTSAGTSNFTVTATDNNGCTGTRAYTITIQSTQTCLFCDDFNDGVQPNWTENKPDFTETGGMYVGTPVRRKAEVVAIPAFLAGCANCYVETNMMTMGGPFNKVWLLGWWVDKNNLVELLMKEETDRWVLKQRQNKTVVSKNKAISTILPGVNYRARVTFDGNTFTVTIDGVQLFTMPKAAGTNPAGTVGFRVKNSTAMWDDITVN